jgi:lipopolysaccharide transport protein LptA
MRKNKLILTFLIFLSLVTVDANFLHAEKNKKGQKKNKVTNNSSSNQKKANTNKKNVSANKNDKKEVATKPSSNKNEDAGLVNLDFKKNTTTITAAQLTLQAKARIFTYEKNVQVLQEDLTINCAKLDGNYSEKNEIEKLVATGNVEILKGANIKAYGNKAVYTAKNEIIELTENPRVEQDGSNLAADKVIIYVNEDRSEAIGNVRVSMIEKDASNNKELIK